MLMDLGPNVYQEDFERAFLKEAAEFYQARARAAREQAGRRVWLRAHVCDQNLRSGSR